MTARILIVLIMLGSFFSCKQEKVELKAVDPYRTQLFKDVQLAALYKDSKTFVDLVPKKSYTILESEYLNAKDNADFDLKAFVEANFEDRSMASLNIKTDTTNTMYEHIEQMWDKLTRGPDVALLNASRIPLPKKYVVPGGRFQEIYYWDSYFTMEGLLAADRHDLAKSKVDNFAFLVDSIGFIPNGTRDYYLSRSQPPFFSMMVVALAQNQQELMLPYYQSLEKEYNYFMKHESIDRPYWADRHVVQMSGGGLMNRYYDTANTPRPEAYKEDIHLAKEVESLAKKAQLYQDLRSAAESGWDFSSRWYAEDENFSSTNTTAILPVDLNCLLYNLEHTLEQIAVLNQDMESAVHYGKQAALRKELINAYLWNKEKAYYMDFNFQRGQSTDELTLAGAYPLFFGIATQDQAAMVKDKLMHVFLKQGGLVTTLKHSGQQWDAPNGWAPLQWIAVNGLLKYGCVEEAKDIMLRWLALNEKVYKDTGKMMEKYNVEDLTLLSGGGEYETQDGFGWTNGVALGFRKLLQQMKERGY